MADEQRYTPLLDRHRSLGGRLIDFAGWQMPIQYTGVVSEHHAVRRDVGVFDVSHLGKLRVSGPSAGPALQEAVTGDTDALEVGRATYALVLNESAGCIDDVFVYRVAENEWLVVPNAANVRPVARAIQMSGSDPVDEWDRWAILAVQGPRSFEVFEKAFPSSGATDLTLHAWCPIDVVGEEGMVARTGYTGERGFELYAPADSAVAAFDRLLGAGCAPVGLGARDTLRLEMGYALYGHELTEEITPLEAGLGWVIAWDTPFRGRAALAEQRADGPRRKLFGVRCSDRGVPRQGYAVVVGEGPGAGERRIGEVTSGNHSPTLGTGIALALGPRTDIPEEGSEVAIDARGRHIHGAIVRPPFVTKGKPKGS